MAPFADVVGYVTGCRGGFGKYSTGMIFVSFHAAAWSVDDQSTSVPQRMQEPVHSWGHFRFPTYGIQTVMGVPHVAHNHCRFSCRPRFPVVLDGIPTLIRFDQTSGSQ